MASFMYLFSQILRLTMNQHPLLTHPVAQCMPVISRVTHSVTLIRVTEEKRTAQGVRRRLWELLAPAGLTEDSGSSPWLCDYRRLLQEGGADEETQKKAVLMQLWATQVS